MTEKVPCRSIRRQEALDSYSRVEGRKPIPDVDTILDALDYGADHACVISENEHRLGCFYPLAVLEEFFDSIGRDKQRMRAYLEGAHGELEEKGVQYCERSV